MDQVLAAIEAACWPRCPRSRVVLAEAGGGLHRRGEHGRASRRLAPHAERYCVVHAAGQGGIVTLDPMAAFRGNYTQEDVMDKIRTQIAPATAALGISVRAATIPASTSAAATLTSTSSSADPSSKHWPATPRPCARKGTSSACRTPTPRSSSTNRNCACRHHPPLFGRRCSTDACFAQHRQTRPSADIAGGELMRVMAELWMVMNLDKCIGCHTCSVTCQQAWTNRSGTEYVWFNNVETRPGQGYPRQHEDQEKWKGGWVLNRRGRLKLRAGGRLKKLAPGIFASPVQPELKDYYEPWTYDYQTLIDAPLGDDFPVARPKSLITGEDTKITWSANWDDDLGTPASSATWTRSWPKVTAGVERLDQVRVRENLHVLPAADLRALPEPLLHGVLPVRCDLQAVRGRHRAGRPGPVPGLAPVHHRLPVQEDLDHPQDRQGREVHVLLPARRGRAAHGLLGDLRRATALSRSVLVRRRRGHRRRRHTG